MRADPDRPVSDLVRGRRWSRGRTAARGAAVTMVPDMDELWHLALPAEWDAAVAAGAYERSTRGRSLAEEGFIHTSLAHQVRGTAELFYADLDELVLLRIDPAKVPAEIKVEGGFPHIYGPLPVDAVTEAVPVRRDAAGQLPLPDGV